MVGAGRIELPTPAMSTQCSTTELRAHGPIGPLSRLPVISGEDRSRRNADEQSIAAGRVSTPTDRMRQDDFHRNMPKDDPGTVTKACHPASRMARSGTQAGDRTAQSG